MTHDILRTFTMHLNGVRYGIGDLWVSGTEGAVLTIDLFASKAAMVTARLISGAPPPGGQKYAEVHGHGPANFGCAPAWRQKALKNNT